MQSWTTQSPFFHPGANAAALAAIGASPETAVRAIQGFLIHGSAVEHYGLSPALFRRETLPVALRLAAVLAADDRPLDVLRSPGARVLVTCRDYALLVCATMRQHGRPARVRCGFASYLEGAPWEDHWLCELWVDNRWQRIDAQLDNILRNALAVTFPCVDVPSAAFMTADEVWRQCRSGDLDGETFGHGEARGLWFVYVNLMRDRLALDDQLTSEWDDWRAAAASPPNLTDPMLASADRLAFLSEGGPPQGPPWIEV